MDIKFSKLRLTKKMNKQNIKSIKKYLRTEIKSALTYTMNNKKMVI